MTVSHDQAKVREGSGQEPRPAEPGSAEVEIEVAYIDTLAAIRRHRELYEHHLATADRAWGAGDPHTSGTERAYADLAMKAWTRALGAAEALERVADALDHELPGDRRTHGRL